MRVLRRDSVAMLHFAYGSNMSSALMLARCPQAEAIGRATLAGWRFVITTDGYGSIVRCRGGHVQGVLWRLALRDLAALDAYESVGSGLYRRRVVTVRCGRRARTAMVYIARAWRAGRPRPGYLHLVVGAAGDWELSEAYVRSLARWSSSRWRGARPPDTGEVG
jgi:gamma-glutamylcyclotransferase (GGCT)/AIG2-like uncharacterized protein YtfP